MNEEIFSQIADDILHKGTKLEIKYTNNSYEIQLALSGKTNGAVVPESEFQNISNEEFTSISTNLLTNLKETLDKLIAGEM